MSEVKKSLFENRPDWEVRVAELLTDPSLDYDDKRLEMFIKRSFAYRGSLNKEYKPAEQNFSAFADAILTANIEDAEHYQVDKNRRIAEIALIMDGLYGTDFSEMKKVYQDSLTLVAREGSYGVWRSSIGRAVSVVRDDLERSEALQEEKIEQQSSNAVVKLRKSSSKNEYKAPAQPDYSDPEDVVKYLFEAGIVSPSHAAALLVTLGFERPQGEISEKLKNDINRVRSDLSARIATYRTQKHLVFDLEGVRILEVFIEKSINNPNLQLVLDDKTRMVSVGSALVSLHQLNEVRTDRPPERSDKYDGTGTVIEFGE